MIFGQMIRMKKRTSFWRQVYKMAFLIEEHGCGITEARKKTGLIDNSSGRMLFNLYLLRRDHLLKLGTRDYFIFERLDNKGFS